MAERDFEIGSRKFKCNKINVMKQFHIVRRIGPMLTQLKAAGDSAGEASAEDNIKNLEPVMVGLSKLSDADSEIVIYGLLAAVEMQQAQGNWARIANGERLMFDDFTLPEMLQVAGRSLMFNMSDFFVTNQQVSHGRG